MTRPKNALIVQGGGPTAVINASLEGIIQAAERSNLVREANQKIPLVNRIFGAVGGMQGLLDRKIIDVGGQYGMKKETMFGNIIMNTPGHALGSSRYKLKDGDLEKIAKIFADYDIGYFFVIGGNDSMDTANRLYRYYQKVGGEVVILGVPKTVDNDLCCMHHSPGFGSAARYVATSVAELYLDTISYTMPAVTILEVMGRNAGWLTAAAVLARECCKGLTNNLLIYLPEKPFDKELFVSQVKKALKKHGQIVIAASEGLRYADGGYLSDTGAVADAFGHKTLGGAGAVLEDIIKTNLNIPGLKTDAIRASKLQRVAMHIASDDDLAEAYMYGVCAVCAAEKGCSGKMINGVRVGRYYGGSTYLGPDQSAEYAMCDLGEVANKERKVPLEWITKDGTDVSRRMVNYLRSVVPANELPRYVCFDRRQVVPPTKRTAE